MGCCYRIFNARFFAIYLPLLLSLFYFLDKHFLPKQYIFEPKKLQELCQQSLELYGGENTNHTLLFQDLVHRLQGEYGKKHVQDLKNDEWVFNNAGGAMGSMVILHASISEYLIIFGTPVGTEGHTGIHMADDYFIILSGAQHSVLPWQTEPTIYRPGFMNHMKRGDGNQYALKGYALELAQGWIPSMLPFGFLDTFTSTLDVGNLWRTVYFTGRHMIGQLLIGKF
ncbi:ERG2/sigma1 receptor-like protein [Kalaharituber pfeilii]|nr:ERG2/sigma1 receptor-like protein [Kalaharituber pfeilii]